MTMKDPVRENGWQTLGTVKTLPSITQVAERLEGNPDVLLHALNEGRSTGWWSYDAVWMTEDGARVRGCLTLHNRHPSDPEDPERDGIDPRDYDPKVNPLNGYFTVVAEADRPWRAHWPSPLEVFLERKMHPNCLSLEYGRHTLMTPLLTDQRSRSLTRMLEALSELPWVAAVLTHDNMDLDPQTLARGSEYILPLIRRLPSSLYGRVLDVRVVTDGDREKVNRILPKYGTHLPEGGMAILLAGDRRKGFGKSDLSFTLDKPFKEGGNIAPVVESLTRMLEGGVMKVDPRGFQELREGWSLLTDAEKAERNAELLKEANEKLEELERQNASLSAALEASNELKRVFQEGGEDILRRAEEALEREERAIKERNRLRKELDRMICMIRDSDLGKAIEAREAAEREVEAAEELLDEQTHVVALLRQENTRLRKELARLGSACTFEAASSEEGPAPSSWDDFFEKASKLEHVVLGDVQPGVDKLRRQVQEDVWLDRSWKALQALEEYAQLKKERGAEALPHFSAYLSDPLAEHVIPRTRYSSTESKGVMMNGRFVAARTFPVPEEVDPSGKVVMEAHIRVGSGKPPAPRMHFHDDTSGNTGKVYVGYIGPHLPNYQTN